MDSSNKLPEIKNMEQRKYDIIVIGATGVTGALVTKHLSTNAPNIAWAICGRSKPKLDKLVQELPAVLNLNKPDILIIDIINDPEDEIKALVEDTKLVIDVVGPYSYWGEKVLKPCVETGTAWVDLNGEVPWAKDMIDKYQALAEKTKAIIVPSCGYDCVPSDIGVYILSRFVGGRLGKVDTVVEKAVGLASYGTLSSLLAPYYSYSVDKILSPNGYTSNPYFLYPQEGQDSNALPTQPTEVVIKRANANINYLGPLKHTGNDIIRKGGGYLVSSTVFEAINRPVVMRSYGLRSSIDEQGKRTLDSYGPNFIYREWHLLPAGRITGVLSIPIAYISTRLFVYILSFAVVRGFLKFIFEKVFGPGYGPSPAVQENGGFRWRFVGEAVDHEPSGEQAVLQMEGQRDVGYGWTSIILSEIALHLVDKLRSSDGTVAKPSYEFGGGTPETVKSLIGEWENRVDDDVVFGKKDTSHRKGGFWTPSCFGMGLAHRLLCTGFFDIELYWISSDGEKKTI